MSVGKKQARQRLAKANLDEYREIILTSGFWDAQVEAILDRWAPPVQYEPLQQRLSYRAVCRMVSWQYRLRCYGMFFLSAPTWWWMLRTYPAWLKHLVTTFQYDLLGSCFTGNDSWLNRSGELFDRQAALRQAHLAALRCHFADLMAAVDSYEQMRIKAAVAVACRCRATGQDEFGDLEVSDVLGARSLAPLLPITR